jgi:hypothetical protein
MEGILLLVASLFRLLYVFGWLFGLGEDGFPIHIPV